jgi:tRNA-specific 2-thiouridylase
MSKILVAMSGGMDSSVAAFLLKKNGHEITGITLELSKCHSDNVKDAKEICAQLGINHITLNLSKKFDDIVVENFTSEYLSGHTPNPCVVCNENIKFGLLLQEARQLGFDCLASGHYARITKNIDGFLVISKGVDAAKEQSYVLYRLSSDKLKNIIFPLGELTKKQVRQVAVENKLKTAQKPESQEICFVEKDYATFLKSHILDFDKKINPGKIVHSNGNVLGMHKGLAFYTIGQRSGLGIAYEYPLYVLKIDTLSNTLIVSDRQNAYKKQMLLKDVFWPTGSIPKFPFKAYVKIRRLHTPASANIDFVDNNVCIEFDDAQFAITPGQSAVFYIEDKVIGGGVIN